MNIVIVSRSLPSKKEPLFGIFELDQAVALAQYGHQVSMISFDTRTRFYRRSIGLSKTNIQSVNSYNLFYPIPFFLLPYKLRLWIIQKMIYFLFQKVVREVGTPDIVHAHYAFGIAYSALIKKNNPNIKLIGTEHWSLIGKTDSRRIKVYTDVAYNIVDKLISVSPSLQKILLEKYNRPSEIIGNIVDTNVFHNTNRRLNTQKFRFVSVGSLIYRKRMNNLIEAFAMANFDNSVYLDIIGDGIEYDKLSVLIKELDIEEQVKLLGQKNRAEIATCLQNSNAFVLASAHETFGVVYIEAMAAGLPVIATKCGGPEEFISEKNGILVPIDDINALTKALINMYQTIDKYNSLEISDDCKQKFSPGVIAKKLTDIYSSK